MEVAIVAIAVPTVAGVASYFEEQSGKCDKHAAVPNWSVAPVTAVVAHSGIPSHAYEEVPACGRSYVYRLCRTIIVWEGIPTRAGYSSVVQVTAVWNIKDWSVTAVNQVHGVVVRTRELHGVKIVILEGNNYSLAGGVVDLITAFVERSSVYRDALVAGDIGPAEDAVGSGVNGTLVCAG